MLFAERILKLRKIKGVTQEILANYIGITRQAVAAYENGNRKPDLKTLIQIADFFNVSTDYLLGRVSLKQQGVYTIGKNIELIKGDMSIQELSKKIGEKTDILISIDKLNDYITGKDEPHRSILKVLAKYGEVDVSFFNEYNTKENYNELKK